MGRLDQFDLLLDGALTIANGQSLSGALQTVGLPLVGVLLPAAWDQADLTFQASFDGVTYGNVHDTNGNEVKLTNGVGGRYFVVPPSALAGCKFLKVRSGTSSTPVNQAADRTLTLVLRTTK